MIEDKIIEKVRKLLALSKSSNEHEAALAAARAQELLFKHNLEMADIKAREDEDEGVGSSEAHIGQESWRRQLLHVVSKFNFCRSVAVRGSDTAVLFGRKHNVEVVQYLYLYLEREIQRLAEEGWTRYQEAEALGALFGERIRKDKASPRIWRNSFRIGAVNVIGRRLEEQANRDKYADANSTALVVASDQEVNAAVDAMFNKTQKLNHRARMDRAGYAAGKRAGEQIGLHQGVHGRTANPEGRRLLGS